MNYPIVRLYDTSKQVADVIDALSAAGFTSDLITIVAPAGGATKDMVAHAIAGAYVLKSEADQYAACVVRGQTAVIVRAVFGTGMKAGKTLDAFNPAPSPVEHPGDWATLWDPATPISCALRAPPLSKGLFSTFWSLPLLTRSNLRLPLPALTDSHSKTVLSRNATPLSAMFKIPLLLNSR